MGVEDIFDLMNMEDKEREKLLKPLTPSQLKASVLFQSSERLKSVVLLSWLTYRAVGDVRPFLMESFVK